MIEMQKSEKFDGMVFFEVLNFDWATMEWANDTSNYAAAQA